MNLETNCPTCGIKLSNPNQKYCEYCGTELINSNETNSEEVKVKFNSARFRRRCC